jgi:hypothetical protein
VLPNVTEFQAKYVLSRFGRMRRKLMLIDCFWRRWSLIPYHGWSMVAGALAYWRHKAVSAVSGK